MSLLLGTTPREPVIRGRTNILSVLVVDDEPIAREELVFLLEQCADVCVLGAVDSASAALEVCANETPDVVFSDLRMPGPDGLALSEAIHARHPRVSVVVVSAHDAGAREAFQAGVLDYLAKPVRLERLRASIGRVRELHVESAAFVEPPLRRLAVRRRNSYVVLDVADVICFEVQHELVWAVTASDRFALDLRLATLAERLPPGEFFRSHRSALVRIDRIRGIEPTGAGSFELVLDHPQGPRVPLARERVRALRERIPFTG